MRPLAGRLALAGAILAGAASLSFADDLTGYVEFSASRNTSRNQIFGLLDTETDLTLFRPRVNVLWNRRLFPYFQAQVGAFYERTDDRIEQLGFEQESELTRFRPFVRLTLRSPQLLGDVGWNRDEETTQTDNLAKFRLTRDTFLTTLGWNPVDLPSARLELSRIVDRDGSKEFVDRAESALRFTSDYKPVDSTRLYYRGSLDQTRDEIAGSEFRTITHNGQVFFSDVYFDSRWEVSGSWNTIYRHTSIEASGAGELLMPVFPIGGSFALDDTPDMATLAPTPALTDGNTVVGTSINLGLVPPAGDNRPRNIGVDLGVVTDINVFRVWVDRNLPFAIASTFTWEIWTSADAQTWTMTSTIATAPFGPFDNRFEIRFPTVLARHVKIVVRPLAPTVPDATSFPIILVTELEPLLAQPANKLEQTVSDTRDLAQASSRFRILGRPSLYYETTYSLVTSTRGTTSWTLSNGLSARHQFDRVWGMSARVAREDGLDLDRDRTAYVYSAAITADPFETLRHSLVLSGYEDDTDGIKTENRGVNFNTTALVYDGVDLNFLVGTSHSKTADGSTNDAFLVGAGATLIPYKTVTVTLRYDDRDATISVEGAPDRDDRTRDFEAGIAYNPVPAVYLYGSRRMEERTSQLDRTVDTFAGSWSPFPGGALQVSVSYNETMYSDLNETDTSFVPFVRWNINARSYLEIAY
ncbi:MAG TPA: hypothetical protein VFG76_05440, partial [Candidatus Polarisedimenticolia bacterium]|nr:hypothetical protein [Candidatus Polarisedimenticolia bacterium]